MIKPKIDKREYKYIVLDNKLEVLVVYDPNTRESSAALAVQSGFYNDPEDSQGLSHFLEHMLFMGTKRYPTEDYFINFVSKNGGSYNAFTSDEMTVYYFDIFNKHFVEALDIFSDFFIEPLLSEDAIQREINAVDSEFKKNESIDGRRLISILKEFVVDNHPFYNFGIGNQETLQKSNIRDKLIKLYNENYSSNLMKLVVFSNLPIMEMENYVKKFFSNIKNKKLIQKSITDLPFENKKIKGEICKHLIKIIPVAETNNLFLIWQLPNLDKYYRYKPESYINHLLGHEAEGSIYYNLRKHGLCHNLNIDLIQSDISCYLIAMSIELTDKGISYIPNIIECINEYINLIKKKIHQWLYDERKTINQIAFDQFIPSNKSDFVIDLVLNMLKYKPDDIIYGPYRLDDYDNEVTKLINNCFDFITSNNLIIVISSKIFENDTTKRDKWFNAKYIDYKSPISFGKEFKYTPMKFNLHLPQKNIYIPKTLKLSKEKFKHKYPVKLDLSDSEIWYKKDTIFKLPKIICSLVIYNDELYKSAENYITVILFLNLLDNYLNPEMYYANLCLSGYATVISDNYIEILFYGFNEGIIKIIKKVIHAFINLKIDEHDFNLIKSNYKNDLMNYVYEEPYIFASNYFQEKMYMINFTNDELLSALEKVTVDKMIYPSMWMIDNCYIKSFIYGNVSSNDALDIAKYFDIFKCHDQNKLINKNHVITLEKGDQYSYIKKSLNQYDDNNVIYLFFEIDKIIRNKLPLWDIKKLCLSFLNLYISDRFFTQLRSKEQTGYVVKASSALFGDEQGTVIGFSFLIQSSKYNPMYLKKRIKNFIKNIHEELKSLDDQSFEQLKFSILQELQKEFTSNIDEFDFYRKEIIRNDRMFNIKDHLIKVLNEVSKKILFDFYETYLINKESRKVRMLTIYKYKKN